MCVQCFEGQQCAIRSVSRGVVEERWALGTWERRVALKHGQPPSAVAKMSIRRGG